MSYLNIAEVETAVVNLASAHPALCQLITLPNTTVEGRTSHALRLGGGAPGSRDCVMIIGGQHAKEWGSCEIILNLAVDLITAFEANKGLGYGPKTFSASEIQQIMGGLHIILFPPCQSGRAQVQQRFTPRIRFDWLTSALTSPGSSMKPSLRREAWT